MLRREQKIRNIILFSLFSILFIGVGYAVISSSLNINGSLSLNKITWDVHFENFQEAIDNSVQAITHTISTDGTTLTYNVKLNKPGDKYSFIVDVVNAGTIDAMVQSLGNSGLTDAQKQVLDYSVTYIDGNNPKQKDALPIGESETFLVSVSAKADITNSQLSSTDTSLTLKLNPTYAQDDGTSVARPNALYEIIKKDAVADNIASDYVESEDGIQYNLHSSDTNGKGNYLFTKTENDQFPIYFYRGAVDNNNVLYKNICFKMVRTTGRGGVRAIYNGVAVNGKCTATGKDTQLNNVRYNISSGAISDVGYMYGTRYVPSTFTDAEKSAGYMYGNDVIYDKATKKYTLQDTVSTDTDWSKVASAINYKHYTCKSSSNQCSTVYYVFYATKTDAYYLKLTDGDNIDGLIEKSNQNINSSNIKMTVDDWFLKNIGDTTDLLDDTYCNDREFKSGGVFKDWGVGDENNWYLNRSRSQGNGIKFTCDKADAFTVSDKYGNGALTYPVAILSADDLTLSGISWKSDSVTTSYLHNGLEWSTMSPNVYAYNRAMVMYTINNGYMDSFTGVSSTRGARPVLTFKNSIRVSLGNGTPDDPYIIN